MAADRAAVAHEGERSRSRRRSPASSPGTFTGKVAIVNKQTAQRRESPRRRSTSSYTLVTSQIFSVDPPAASLGQYVFVHGGGFVGGEPGALTEIELAGHVHQDRRQPGAGRR